ncbi:hypothetical protein C7B80_30265 [Cyanosarcina cf. burmensis CCALA 770]|nr:hypothetical protein C7B80_30265 [Cyanosarcina cf. burmensis CCALA 770]
MLLSQTERHLAAEIDFDESVLEMIKQECQVKMQKILLKQEVYLKDSELSCVNEILPAYYLEFEQDIYGVYNYGGNLLVEGLSIIIPSYIDYRDIFVKLKQSLNPHGYLTSCENRVGLTPEKNRLNQYISRVLNYVTQAELRIAVFKGEEPWDIIKIHQTNGWNYDISPKDIINKLKSWREVCEFEIIFASKSSLSLEFVRPPTDIEKFAKNVVEFCPDLQNTQLVASKIEKYKSLYLTWN